MQSSLKLKTWVLDAFQKGFSENHKGRVSKDSKKTAFLEGYLDFF